MSRPFRVGRRCRAAVSLALAVLGLCLGRWPAAAGTVVFDRIGPDGSLAAGLPGAMAIHTHPDAATTDFWGTPAARWTQTVTGELETASCLFFGRDVRDLPLPDGAWNSAERPLADFTWTRLSFHLWTNGLAGFRQSPQRGDVVIPVGDDLRNAATTTATTTNQAGIVFPLWRYDFRPATVGVAPPTLTAGREYLMAFVFDAPQTNQVIRVSLSRSAGEGDAYGGANLFPPAPGAGLLGELGFTHRQLAMALSVASVTSTGRLTVTGPGPEVTLTWDGGDHVGFEESADPESGWRLLPDTANRRTLVVPLPSEGAKFYRVRWQ